MELRFYALCFTTCLLLATSLIYGLKFLKKRNYLLGLEWLVITLSTLNLLLYLLSGAQFAYNISYFCDAFSRGFGIPIIAIAGLMAVTHRYKPSIRADVGFFAVSIAGTAILVAADFMKTPKPYFYVVMWAVFSAYLAYFAKRLLNVGESRHALGVIVALLSSQAIACMYDFYKIPGDDEQHTLFFVIALTVWSYLCVELYYSYCALERAERK
jgi:hypothetical protein